MSMSMSNVNFNVNVNVKRHWQTKWHFPENVNPEGIWEAGPLWRDIWHCLGIVNCTWLLLEDIWHCPGNVIWSVNVFWHWHWHWHFSDTMRTFDIVWAMSFVRSHSVGTIDIVWSTSNVLGQCHLSLRQCQLSLNDLLFQGTFDIFHWHCLSLNYPTPK